MQAPLRVGIDVGGTFTDFIAQGADNDIAITKVSSTPADPSVAVIDALDAFLAEADVAASDIRSVFHGSTVSTNAVIERDGAETALFITEGYNAVPVVGTMSRPQSEALNPFYSEADDEFLLPNARVFEVPERVRHDGSVARSLDENALRRTIRAVEAAGIDSIAVCYLFSFMNPDHEERTLELIEAEHPDCFVSLSSRVVPKIREYDRMSTTTINAYVDPVLSTYLTTLRTEFREEGIETDRVYLMLSHGGVVPFETATTTTSRTLLSGPAAGVKGAAFFGERIGERDLLTMDMGGTSCDISIIRDGALTETKEGALEQYPLAFPMIEINAIGAGGGTQARVEANRLRIGPESSGADPGPICYGRGGEIPTITDANVVLGRLNQETLLGGEIDVDLARTERIVEERIAEPLSLDVTEAAAGILQIVNDVMKKEINVQFTNYGYDPREFSLFAFGGAGPTHAARIAAKLDIPTVLVPPWPGINSAAGLLTTDIQQEYVTSKLDALAAVSVDALDARFADLERRAVDDRLSEGFADDEIALGRKLDLRYEGQGYELTVDVGEPIDKERIREAFDDLHDRRFGYRSEEPVEVVSYGVSSTVAMPDLETEPMHGPARGTARPDRYRDVYYPDAGEWVDTPVYRRADLDPGHAFEGPGIVEQLDTTVVVEPGQRAEMDAVGNVRIEVR